MTDILLFAATACLGLGSIVVSLLIIVICIKLEAEDNHPSQRYIAILVAVQIFLICAYDRMLDTSVQMDRRADSTVVEFQPFRCNYTQDSDWYVMEPGCFEEYFTY
jgi:hypothetical protein